MRRLFFSRSPEPERVPQPNPDHAWKLLGLVNEWIRHSDTKAGVTLAFTGVLATMTFNLSKSVCQGNWLFYMAVIIASVLLILTGALCGWTLTPRVNDKDADPESINRLFFGSISQHFKGDRPRYTEVLSTLSADPHELTRDLADQIHANARIATVKAKFVKWAIRSALTASAAIAALATIVGMTNI